MSDAEIDAAACADAENPPVSAAEWAALGTIVEPAPKVPISLRVDADVLQWFRATSSRYQSRMNAVLRAYMQHEQARTPKRRGKAHS